MGEPALTPNSTDVSKLARPGSTAANPPLMLLLTALLLAAGSTCHCPKMGFFSSGAITSNTSESVRFPGSVTLSQSCSW
jgi:hypothetical protein